MTSLEFIEKEIEKEKITIRVNTSLLSQFDNEDDVANNVLSTKIMIAENRLNILKQIKNELEAWEVVEPYVDIIDKDTPYPFWQLKPNYDECKLKETNILIKAKALEVDK